MPEAQVAATHSFAPGERVAVINRTLSGRFFVESRDAVIVRRKRDDIYHVRFPGDRHFCTRFVDPAAQADPDAEVRRLNGEG